MSLVPSCSTRKIRSIVVRVAVRNTTKKVESEAFAKIAMNKAGDIISLFLEGKLLDHPGQLSEALVILSGHMFNLGTKIIEAEVAYAKKWEELRPNCKTDKECDIKLKTQPEYTEMEQAKFAYKTTQEVIRSVKKRLAVLSDEAKLNY